MPSQKKLKSHAFALVFTGINLLIHELLINGSYYNSNIPAMLFLYLAAYVLVKTNCSAISVVGAALLAVVAFFFRVDVILMLPALVLILIFRKKYKSVALAIAVFVITAGVITITQKVSFGFVGSITQHHFGHLYQNSFPILHTMLAIPLSIIILSFLGFIYHCRNNNFRIIIFILLFWMPLFIFYFLGNTTPKYMLYAYPVVSWLAVDGLLSLRNSRDKILGLITICLLIIILIEQILFTGMSFAFNRNSFNFLQKRGLIVVPTQDGFRAVTGLIFYPYEMFQMKIQLYNRIDRMLKCAPDENRVFWIGWNYYGIFNYIFTQEAIKITKDHQHQGSAKIYHMKNNTKVRVIEFRVDASHETLQKAFYPLYKEGNVNIFLASNINIIKKILNDKSDDIKFYIIKEDKQIFVAKKNVGKE